MKVVLEHWIESFLKSCGSLQDSLFNWDRHLCKLLLEAHFPRTASFMQAGWGSMAVYVIHLLGYTLLTTSTSTRGDHAQETRDIFTTIGQVFPLFQGRHRQSRSYVLGCFCRQTSSQAEKGLVHFLIWYLCLVGGLGILVLPLSPLRGACCQRVLGAARAGRSSPEYVHEPLHRPECFLPGVS